MKLIALLLCLILAGPALADTFTYTETKHFDSPSATTTLLFEQKFSRLGFIALEQSGMGNIPGLNMDQVFEKDDQVIFFKQGLKPSDSKLIGQLISRSKGLLYHGVSAAGVNYALFFKNFKQSQAEAILKNMELLSSKKYSIEFSLMPVACAAEGNDCDPKNSNLTALNSVATFIDPARIQTLMTSCLLSVVNGVKDGAKDVYNTLKTLFTDPEKLWDDVVKKYEQVKDFVLNIKPRMIEFVQSLKEMDAEMIAEIVCPIMGSVGIKILMGGGVAAASALLMQKFLSIQRLSGVLAKFSRLKRSGNRNINALTNKVVACAR